jgi:hypothetical protein
MGKGSERAEARVKAANQPGDAAAAVPAAPADAAQTAHNDADRTREAQDRFIDAFAELGTVVDAARASGVGRRTHYDWLETDPGYQARFAAAERDAADELLKEARKRAMDRSDRLLMELLRAFLPDRFARRLEHTGKGGAPIAHAVTVKRDLSMLTEAELAEAERLARKVEGADA